MKLESKGYLVVAGSFILGATLGALITRNVLKAKYEEYVAEEIDQVKTRYRTLYEEDENFEAGLQIRESVDERRTPPSDEMLEAHAKLVELYSEPDEKVTNAFTESAKYEVEIQESIEIKRDPSKPYLISLAMFMEKEEDGEYYDKITLNYFEDDDVLCDDREMVVDDIEGTIGMSSLNMFGQLSENPDLVYIRNERISSDFEICRNEGSFSNMIMGVSHEVLGLKEPKAKIKKMRNDE